MSDGRTVACNDLTQFENYKLLELSKTPTKLVLRDQDAYTAAIARAGLDPDWVSFGDYTYTGNIFAKRWLGDGSGPHAANFAFADWPVENSSMVVPNPKDVVTKAIGNIPSLRSDMEDTVIDIMTGHWTNGSISDPSQAYSAPVFMLMQAVDGMAQAKQLGKQEEEEEEEEERKRKENLILLIVSIVMMVSFHPSLPQGCSTSCLADKTTHPYSSFLSSVKAPPRPRASAPWPAQSPSRASSATARWPSTTRCRTRARRS
jgi:hypothetical protein